MADSERLQGYANAISKSIDGAPEAGLARMFLLGKSVTINDMVREVSEGTEWGKKFAQELEEFARTRSLTVEELIGTSDEENIIQPTSPAQVDSPEG